jgi:hypothetical protein
MFPFLDASRKAFSSFRHFVRSILPLSQVSEPAYLDPSVERVLDAEMRNTRSTVVSGVGEPEFYDPIENSNDTDSTSYPLADPYHTVHSSIEHYAHPLPIDTTPKVRWLLLPKKFLTLFCRLTQRDCMTPKARSN